MPYQYSYDLGQEPMQEAVAKEAMERVLKTGHPLIPTEAFEKIKAAQTKAMLVSLGILGLVGYGIYHLFFRK